jgi:hypothetical protein
VPRAVVPSNFGQVSRALESRASGPELCRRLGDEVDQAAVVSRHFDDLDAVLESDSLDDFRQLVFALQSPPGFCGRGDELEHHELGQLKVRVLLSLGYGYGLRAGEVVIRAQV